MRRFQIIYFCCEERAGPLPPDLQPVVDALAGSRLLFPSHKGQRCLFFSHLSCITKGICQPLHNSRIHRCFGRPCWRQPRPQRRAAVAGRLLLAAGRCVLHGVRWCIPTAHDAVWLMLVTHHLGSPLPFYFFPPPPWKGRCGIVCSRCGFYFGEQKDGKVFGGVISILMLVLGWRWGAALSHEPCRSSGACA